MAWKRGDDIGSWEVIPTEYEDAGDFAGKIQVTLPSDIWISPASARKFAAELLKAADDQEKFDRGSK